MNEIHTEIGFPFFANKKKKRKLINFCVKRMGSLSLEMVCTLQRYLHVQTIDSAIILNQSFPTPKRNNV